MNDEPVNGFPGKLGNSRESRKKKKKRRKWDVLDFCCCCCWCRASQLRRSWMAARSTMHGFRCFRADKGFQFHSPQRIGCPFAVSNGNCARQRRGKQPARSWTELKIVEVNMDVNLGKMGECTFTGLLWFFYFFLILVYFSDYGKIVALEMNCNWRAIIISIGGSVPSAAAVDGGVPEIIAKSDEKPWIVDYSQWHWVMAARRRSGELQKQTGNRQTIL